MLLLLLLRLLLLFRCLTAKHRKHNTCILLLRGGNVCSPTFHHGCIPQPGLPEGVLIVSKGNGSAGAAERFPRHRPAGPPSLSGLVPPARASVP